MDISILLSSLFSYISCHYFYPNTPIFLLSPMIVKELLNLCIASISFSNISDDNSADYLTGSIPPVVESSIPQAPLPVQPHTG